jgi:TolB-like protein/tetratricopeptide (TPR) repeat protein
MPSIIPNYEYDIFISYRHNDNRSGWVTEFVNALQEELSATIKEPLTIYFDKNPHDGLLENHNVDKSLEGKLKCLIFIPIISQTYCDTNSFAWQHEFCAFNRSAIEGTPFSSGEGKGMRSIGRDIKLSNGNVASRILPIKIHDLDAEDKLTIENEIGGVLRAIEFIYKEAGVNRPLKSTDNKIENQNKTDYRNQVNKVANAVKEIITALKIPVAHNVHVKQHHPIPKINRKPLAAILTLTLLIAVAGFFLYPKLLQETITAIALDKSIAVLPFVDLSEAKDQGWFSDGLTEEILNSLAHIEGLNVISRTSSFAFKNKNLRIQTIADSLGVNYVVEGSVRKSDNNLRITAQLIRAKDGFHIWSNTYDRNSKDIFVLQQEIATKIAESLDISLDPKAIEHMQRAGTSNPEAFVVFLKGQGIFNEAHIKRSELLPYLKRANINFDEAIRLDPDFINPYLYKGDFFFHYLTKSEKSVYNDTITEAQAYQQMRKCIENAIAKSKTEIEKDYYNLYLIMFSNDWSSMRPIIERVLKSPEAVRLFSYQPFNLTALLTCLGYGKQIVAINLEILKKDPLNNNRKIEIVEASMFSGNYLRAIESIDSLGAKGDHFRLNFSKLNSLYHLKKFDEAHSLLGQLDETRVSSYYSILAMLLAKRGELEEARKVMDKDSRDVYTLSGIDVTYGREAANREASMLDKNLVMHHVLLFDYLYTPKNLPFDLSATPNFVKRFRQAGVALE